MKNQRENHIGNGWITKPRKTDGAPVLQSKQWCNECGKAIEPIFKSDPRNADTWFWTECDICGDPVCEECSDFDDEEGVRTCIACYRNQIFFADDRCPIVK